MQDMFSIHIMHWATHSNNNSEENDFTNMKKLTTKTYYFAPTEIHVTLSCGESQVGIGMTAIV